MQNDIYENEEKESNTSKQKRDIIVDEYEKISKLGNLRFREIFKQEDEQSNNREEEMKKEKQKQKQR